MEFNIYDMIFSVINFFVLVFILKRFLYKPVLATLDSRKDEIQSKYRQADEANGEAVRLQEESKAELKKARTEAKQIISQASQIGEETKLEILNEAEGYAANLTKKAQEEANLEKEKAKAELRDMATDLAVLLAEKILKKSIQPEDRARLIQEFIGDLGEDLGQIDISQEGRSQIVEAEARSATALTNAELSSLEDRLSKALGQQVHLTNVIEPDIIGGLAVKIGDMLIDGSVTKQLSLLKEHLQKAQISGSRVGK